MLRRCSRCGTQAADDARFCRHCGTSLVAPPTSRPAALWIGVGGLVVALALAAGAGVWWLKQSRAAAMPTFDSAPPPSVLGAGSAAASPTAAAPVPADAAPAALPLPAAAARVAPVASTPRASEAAGSRPEAGRKATVIARPAGKPVQAATKPTKEKAARDARAKALRERRARADADAARRRAAAVRPRVSSSAPPPAPPPAPVARTSTPTPAPSPAQPRTVQERCAHLNPLAKGICESRACVRAEHAGEAVCQRIRAADDRRREQ